jgi:hypothetical protein
MGSSPSKSKDPSKIVIPPDGTISPVIGNYKVKGILGNSELTISN